MKPALGPVAPPAGTADTRLEMSQENVEVVRRLLADDADVVPLVRDEATYAGIMGELEAFVEADCAFAWIGHGLRGIEATGLEEARRGWLDWLEPESYHVQIERLIPVGDKVLVLSRMHARMAGTQNDVEMMGASIYLVRDGRVARIEHYGARAEAFEAAGLLE
jgi:ketosteroid isomerase-like protein